jgi:hypothetical protein
MADQENLKEALPGAAEPQAEEKPKKDRGPVKLLLGVTLLVATGGALSVMAIPAKPVKHTLEGPFFTQLLDEIVVSTPDGNASRYLKFRVGAEYAAYEEVYQEARLVDPFYTPYLKSKAELIASSHSLIQSAIGAEREAFSATLRRELEPIVFPVHIGETTHPLDADELSGLRPGVSHHMATFRGRFHEWTLYVDSPGRTVRLGDGLEVIFEGNEDDLEVRSQVDDTVYVDVTHIDPGFMGEVKIGVHGKLRKLLLEAIGQ